MVSPALPVIQIHSDRIAHNAAVALQICEPHGVEVTGVVKAACGMPAVASAMVRAGITNLADVRISNLQHLRDAGIHATFTLLRPPAPSEAGLVVDLADYSLNTETDVIDALAEAASNQGVEHGVLLALDLAEGREGLPAGDLPELAERLELRRGVRFAGIATTLGSHIGVPPSPRLIEQVVTVADQTARRLGRRVPVISGGNSSVLSLLLQGRLPPAVNQLRLGEAILLGRYRVQGSEFPLPGGRTDAFELVATVTDVRDRRDTEGRGLCRQALVALGSQELPAHGLRPLTPGVTVLGANSFHFMLDVSQAEGPVRPGDEVRFALTYWGLMGAMNSPSVSKRVVPGKH